MFGSKLIEDRVRNPKQKGPAIVPFITAGYPHKDDFLSLVQALADCADVIEIGVLILMVFNWLSIHRSLTPFSIARWLER